MTYNKFDGKAGQRPENKAKSALVQWKICDRIMSNLHSGLPYMNIP